MDPDDVRRLEARQSLTSWTTMRTNSDSGGSAWLELESAEVEDVFWTARIRCLDSSWSAQELEVELARHVLEGCTRQLDSLNRWRLRY